MAGPIPSCNVSTISLTEVSLGSALGSTSSFTMRIEGRCSSRPSDVRMVCVTFMYPFRMVADNAAGRYLVTLSYAPPFSTVPSSTKPVIWRDFPCE
jgi:hypothetical protein